MPIMHEYEKIVVLIVVGVVADLLYRVENNMVNNFFWNLTKWDKVLND